MSCGIENFFLSQLSCFPHFFFFSSTLLTHNKQEKRDVWTAYHPSSYSYKRPSKMFTTQNEIPLEWKENNVQSSNTGVTIQLLNSVNLKVFLPSKFKRKWPDKNGFEECLLTIWGERHLLPFMFHCCKWSKQPSTFFLTYDMRKALVCEKTWQKRSNATVLHTCKGVLARV